MRLNDDWETRQATIKAARKRLAAREADRVERRRQQNHQDLKALRRLDDRRDRQGRRS